jgi:hypothetical protein
MRPMDSAYDRREGSLITEFLRALRATGHTVVTHVNGAVSIDGHTWDSEAFDDAAHRWDCDEDSLRQDRVDHLFEEE